MPKAPGRSCCCRTLRSDRNSERTPVSSCTSRTAVAPGEEEEGAKGRKRRVEGKEEEDQRGGGGWKGRRRVEGEGGG